jgi:hypothetical protein
MAGLDARSPAMLIIEEGKTAWTVRQIFDDPSRQPRLEHLSHHRPRGPREADGTAVTTSF